MTNSHHKAPNANPETAETAPGQNGQSGAGTAAGMSGQAGAAFASQAYAAAAQDAAQQEGAVAEGTFAQAASADPHSDALAAAEAEKAEMKDKLLRTLADMENLRRRTEKEIGRAHV